MALAVSKFSFDDNNQNLIALSISLVILFRLAFIFFGFSYLIPISFLLPYISSIISSAVRLSSHEPKVAKNLSEGFLLTTFVTITFTMSSDFRCNLSLILSGNDKWPSDNILALYSIFIYFSTSCYNYHKGLLKPY